MRQHRIVWPGIVCWLALASPPLWAAPPAVKTTDTVADLAVRIDKYIDARLAEEKIPAAPVADDAEFLRRVYLDLAGRIPAVSEVHAFLRDPTPDKRRKIVAELLRGGNHVSHFTNIWRTDLIAAANSQQATFFGQQLEPWIRKHLRDNTPYDRMVRELLTTPLAGNSVRQFVPSGELTAVAFFQANELKSETLAASTSRLFLGVQLQCAECHNHPFAKWKREQFWEYAAFFAGINPQQQRGNRVPVSAEATASKPEIQIPDTRTIVQAKFLDGTEPKWQGAVEPRATLAEWITSPTNPYFARARVNRLWAHLFGLGLVEPVDDFSDDNHPLHPELLNELAAAFVTSKFDTHFLIEAICASKAYQRTSAVTNPTQTDNPRLFARMSMKGMTAEMLFDSLAHATGFVPTLADDAARGGAAEYNVGRAEFLARFSTTTDKRTEHQTTILQALSLMNGKLIENVTDLVQSRTLAAVIDGPFKDERERLDALFLATLSRPMRPDEATRYTKYVRDGGPSGDSKKALADVFWALLNSTEFALNH